VITVFFVKGRGYNLWIHRTRLHPHAQHLRMDRLPGEIKAHHADPLEEQILFGQSYQPHPSHFTAEKTSRSIVHTIITFYMTSFN
jgi:hypothetical protein